MFQYATACALSLRTGRTLALDAVSGFVSDPYGRQYALGDFQLSASLLTAEEAKLAAKHTYFRARAVRETEDLFKNSLGYGYVGALLRLIAAGDMYLDGYWQSEKYFVDVAGAIQAELTCKRGFCEASKAALSQISVTESVSVHVRRKDYPLLCSRAYYRQAVRLLCDKTENPAFFFFGDDKAWIENLMNDLELPFQCKLVQGGQSDIEEFELMRACRHHIIANSTFSWWAAWLSEQAQTDSIIVAPATGWSSKREFVTDVVPSRWNALALDPAR